ncbi:hypothetical protein GHK92_14200 [Nocardioides sp. dk4132]|uniref:hypothetical protein n=1 Tax=unclassified Nocardioides TaxID=2615069 RepID=UPI0012948869|nr:MULTISPECIES: hypothetical protein [unclassified Nocardioides]MQW77030.1 hypothetical protein [Nocardioides sp. dk4132]QGA09439.1 hypothetical protein GFH29_20105 [Nocardioides sp. dk884]
MGGCSRINAGSVVTGMLATLFGLGAALGLALTGFVFAVVYGWWGVAVLAVLVGAFAAALTYRLRRGSART